VIAQPTPNVVVLTVTLLTKSTLSSIVVSFHQVLSVEMLAASMFAPTSPLGNHGKHAPNHVVKVFVVASVIASAVKLVRDTAVPDRTVVPNLFKLLHATEVIAVTGNGQVGLDVATTVLSAAMSVTDSNATVVLMRWSVNKVTALPIRFKPVPLFKLNPLLSALTA